jgi:hypothetical protein
MKARLCVQRIFIGPDWPNDGLETVANTATPTKAAMNLAMANHELHSM